MTVPGTDFGNYLGARHGGHWTALAQAQSSAAQQAHLSNLGAFGSGYSALAARRPAIKDAGIRTGEIIAFRAWIWSRGLLRSMAADFAWMPGEVVQGVPSTGLGVHAFKTLGDAVGQYSAFASNGTVVVFGTVALWGEVIEHEKGYRAEFGAIESIVMTTAGERKPRKWQFWRRPRNVLSEIRFTYGLGTQN
jgi:hypothetical protein